MTSSVTTAQTTTYFVVYEIQYLTTGDIITQYVDPTPGVMPTSNQGTLTLPSTEQLASTNELIAYAGNYGTTGNFDEIRLGASYYSVAPDPKVAPGDNSGASSNRRASHRHRTSPFLGSVPTHKHVTSSDLLTKTAKTSAPAFYPGSSGAWRWVNNDANSDSFFSTVSNNTSSPWKGLFN
jgi:hypothetical protein